MIQTNTKIKPENAKLISFPKDNRGSSMISFDLEENNFFEIFHGIIGGIKITTLTIKDCDSLLSETICWEGYVDFKTVDDILLSLTSKPGLLLSIIERMKESEYMKGKRDGEKNKQNEIREVLGLNNF